MSERKFYVERFTGNGTHVHELPGANHVGVLLESGDTVELSQPYLDHSCAEVRSRSGRLVLTPQAANVVIVATDGGGGCSDQMQGPEDAEQALHYALQGCSALERMAADMNRSSASTSSKASRLVRANEIRLYVRQIREALR